MNDTIPQGRALFPAPRRRVFRGKAAGYFPFLASSLGYAKAYFCATLASSANKMWTAREMRRAERRLPLEKARKLLEEGAFGVLATADAGGVPLATPLSYVVLGDKLYFHCANEGQKLENIAAQPRVCFCVVGKNNAVYATSFTTHYESVMVHGAAAIVQNKAEKHAVLRALCQKYLPQHMDKANAYIEGSFKATTVVGIAIEEVSGKSNRPGASGV